MSRAFLLLRVPDLLERVLDPVDQLLADLLDLPLGEGAARPEEQEQGQTHRHHGDQAAPWRRMSFH
jgi:hypothetical protein